MRYYSYSWLEPRMGFWAFKVRFWIQGMFKSCSYHCTDTIFQFVYFDVGILFTSCSFALIVNTSCNSLVLVLIICFICNLFFKSVSQSSNWIKAVNICDNETSSQSCFIIIVFKKYFIFQYEKMFLQDTDQALTSIIVWSNYMISEYHTQIILET